MSAQIRTITRPIAAVLAFVLVAWAVAPSFAQGSAPAVKPDAPPSQAPAGNAHPDQQIVRRGNAPVSPFGQPAPRSSFTDTGKAAFAEAVDLAPLRDLAVLHNGRVKILDTMAREMVGALTGRHDFVDFIMPESGDARDIEKVGYDPLFTMLDMMIDPAFYVREPVVHIEYLPLREAYLAMAFPDDTDAQQRWKKLTRISPAMIEAFSTDLFNRYADSAPYREGIQKAERANDLFVYGVNNLQVIAPDDKTDSWHHLGEAGAMGAPGVAEAARALGAAWRAGDAPGVNSAVATLAAEIPAINAGLYPSKSRSLELAYNRSNAFEWGYWVYFFSLLALVLAFGTGRKWLIVTGNTLLIAALALHAFGFVARCLIAERFAIQNQFESMTGLSLFAALVGLVIMVARKQWLFGAAAAACGFLVLITATETAIPGKDIGREAAILNTSVLLKYHVTTVLTSYGLVTLGFVCSLFYLATHYGAKVLGRRETPALAVAAVGGGTVSGGGDAGGGESPTLARTLGDLDTAQMIILQLAFWTLGVGILLGAWWADHSWGRWWAFDPKETWALITWIVYLIVIHVRFGAKNKALVTAWLSVAGFIVMLWTYFGVNLLLPGLHAYA
jgi:cytochrome c-type biogenesis protein CcsB